ncbi:MAG: acyl-CoA thioesterase [Campylobacteraceae bacterium]
MSILVFSHELKVSRNAIDTNLHVNNVSYIQWMQDAAIAHSEALGFSMEFYVNSGESWVARSHYIEYLKPAFLDDDIVVQTWITNIKRTMSERHYAFFRKSDKVLLASAKTLWVYIDMKTGRPIAIPKNLTDKYIAQESYKPTLA